MADTVKSSTRLLGFILLFLLGILSFFGWKIYRLKSQPAASLSFDLIAATYTDPNGLYQIQYPENWQMESLPVGVGFGPKEIDDGIIWAVLTYDKASNPKDKIISNIDKQMPDRVQTTEVISINGINADKVTTASLSQPKFSSETIIIEAGKSNVVISNGGIDDEELKAILGRPAEITFKQFYSSFKLLN